MDEMIGILVTTAETVIRGYTDLVWFLGRPGAFFVLGYVLGAFFKSRTFAAMLNRFDGWAERNGW